MLTILSLICSSWLTLAAPTAPVAAHSTFTETGFVIEVKKEIAEQMIGPEQELIPQEMVDPNFNRILFRHIQYHDMTGVDPVTPAFAYNEFLVYVPNTKLKTGYTCGGQEPGQAAFMPILYLDQQLPVDLGVQYYGFNKHLANMTASKTGFEVGLLDGTPLYSALFGNEKGMDYNGMTVLDRILREVPQALMGRLNNSDGTSTMVWSGLTLNADNAQIYSLDVTASVKAALMAGLESLVGEYARGGVNTDYWGGYRIENASLELTQPVPCQAP